MITIEKIKKALEKAIHPEFDKSLVEFGMIRDIKTEKNKIIIVLVLPFLHVPIREQLIRIIKEIIKENFSIIPNIEIEEMNQEEKRKFGEMVKQLRSPSL